MGNMAARKDTPERLLNSVTRLAKKVVREFETTRFVEGTNQWVFALFAKQIDSVASVRALVAISKPWDTILIIRSIYDALFQICFILNTDRPRTEILELISIEIAVDRYDELKFHAAFFETSVQRLVATYPIARERVDHYEWAKRHPAFNERREWPKRLRYLSADELKATMKYLWNPLLQYLVTSQGDSAAHSRFAAIANFAQLDELGNVRLSMKPQPSIVHDPPIIIVCAFLCVLITTDMLVNRFGFGDPLAASVSRLHKRWLAMSKEDELK